MTAGSFRRAFLGGILVLAFVAGFSFRSGSDAEPITREHVAAAEQIIGLSFTDAKRDSMLDGLTQKRESYEAIRSFPLAANVPPAMQFNPLPMGFQLDTVRRPIKLSAVERLEVPQDLNDLAFASIAQLAELIRTRHVTSEQLTRMYLDRLKKYGPTLECVITLTEERALRQARKADAEIAAGRYRGPLHGIPYGAKDLLAVKGYKTTWGAMPYKDQVLDEDATVIQRLDGAGAVLVAKLTLGALAWGDVWYGGMTRNPWDLSEGSSGSSAGSAAATAAGLVGFAIGSETWGSIVSPCTRCGATGLRPTYGRVSRAGAMALSWSMDKLGPICRTVEDCAIVLDAIRGPDGVDQTVIDAPFNYDPFVSLKDLRIGFLKVAFDSAKANRGNNEAVLDVLRKLGATLVPVELPQLPTESISFILDAEAGAAFDDLTRSGRDDEMVRQIKNAWPNVFRASRFIPAVEYLQANRIRSLLVQAMGTMMKDIDVYVAPPFEGENLLLTNLTGHPCVVLPDGFTEKGTPTSITFMGQLFGEAKLLAVAKAYQDATDFHRKHPPLEPWPRAPLPGMPEKGIKKE
jgi:Asp-tRNA(Asn)/Glu-tRNA(Gln) amidotransferase A subunit family amidase